MRYEIVRAIAKGVPEVRVLVTESGLFRYGVTLMQIKKVILEFQTHFDIGFTKLLCGVHDYAGKMLIRVAKTCDATRDMGALNTSGRCPHGR